MLYNFNMLSTDFIRENKEKVAEAAKNKRREVDLDKILSLDVTRREHLQKAQKLSEEKNKLAKETDHEAARQRGRELKESLRKLGEEQTQIETELHKLLSQVPNIPLPEVPVGGEEANKELSHWGEKPKFDFTPLSHIELAQKHDLVDFTAGAKISGFRGYFLKNEAAIVQTALLFWIFQKLVSKGYTPLVAPAIVKGFSLFGSGQFPWGEQEVYKLNDDDAYLAGTAEVPVTAYLSDKTLEAKELPKKFVAFSSCYRREAGSYGKDTKGLYRVHEFWKIEQVIIARCDVEGARKLHQELQQNSEEILQELELPYRVILMATAEMGEPQILKYDTETWMPSRDAYCETMSNSIMGDFQARRLNIKYRDAGEAKFCYTLNNTAVASPRILIALLENHQQKDGSIKIPKALQDLCGFDKISV